MIRRRRSRGPQPRPPDWALSLGLSPPLVDESFCAYCQRLGLDCDEFLAGLSECSYGRANQRLAAEIMRGAPESFKRYLDARHAAI